MSLPWFRKSLPPPPLRTATAVDFRRMSRHPSAYAPTAAEVLNPATPPPIARDSHPLLQAVLAHPDDDAPRLAYAEWIDACDPARGEFIRLHLRSDPAAARLLEANGPRWNTAFSSWGARDFVYRRGFVEGVSLTGRSFISLGASLFEATLLREVRLIAVAFLMEELIACPHLVRLESLDLRGNRIGEADAARLRIAFSGRLSI